MNHRSLPCRIEMLALGVVTLCLTSSGLRAQSARRADTSWAQDAPVLSSLVAFARSESDLRVAVNRYLEDRGAILRRYEVQYSPVRHQRLRRFYDDWRKQLLAVEFKALNHEGRIDYVLLRNRVTYDLEMLALDERRWKEIAPLVPFGEKLRLLQEVRHDRKRVDPRAAAATLTEVADEATRLTAALTDKPRSSGAGSSSGMGAVLGAIVVGSQVSSRQRRQDRHALLADAPRRPNHLFVELPARKVVGPGSRRLPRGPRRA